MKNAGPIPRCPSVNFTPFESLRHLSGPTARPYYCQKIWFCAAVCSLFETFSDAMTSSEYIEYKLMSTAKSLKLLLGGLRVLSCDFNEGKHAYLKAKSPQVGM